MKKNRGFRTSIAIVGMGWFAALAGCGYYDTKYGLAELRLGVEKLDLSAGSRSIVAAFPNESWRAPGRFIEPRSFTTAAADGSAVVYAQVLEWAADPDKRDASGANCYIPDGWKGRRLALSRLGDGSFRLDQTAAATVDVAYCFDTVVPGAAPALRSADWARVVSVGAAGLVVLAAPAAALTGLLAGRSAADGLALLQRSAAADSLTETGYAWSNGATLSASTYTLSAGFYPGTASVLLDPPGYAVELATLDPASGASVRQYRFPAAGLAVDLRPPLAGGADRLTGIVRVFTEGADPGAFVRRLDDGLCLYSSAGVARAEFGIEPPRSWSAQALADGGWLIAVYGYGVDSSNLSAEAVWRAQWTTRFVRLDRGLNTVGEYLLTDAMALGFFHDSGDDGVYVLAGRGERRSYPIYQETGF